MSHHGARISYILILLSVYDKSSTMIKKYSKRSILDIYGKIEITLKNTYRYMLYPPLVRITMLPTTLPFDTIVWCQDACKQVKTTALEYYCIIPDSPLAYFLKPAPSNWCNMGSMTYFPKSVDQQLTWMEEENLTTIYVNVYVMHVYCQTSDKDWEGWMKYLLVALSGVTVPQEPWQCMDAANRYVL